tara:strand:+ start:386 stop:610 length:225 start_codon:yes stop_codon:yes gene_type:complete
MLNDNLRIGQIIYWTDEPLALLMRPEDAGRLWKIGLLIDRNIRNKCIIMKEGGDLIHCDRAMVREYTTTKEAYV